MNTEQGISFSIHSHNTY